MTSFILQRECLMMMCRGFHPRLGGDSPIMLVGPDVIRMITSHLRFQLVRDKLAMLEQSMFDQCQEILKDNRFEQLVAIPARYGRTYKYHRCVSRIIKTFDHQGTKLIGDHEMYRWFDARYTDLFDRIHQTLRRLGMLSNDAIELMADQYYAQINQIIKQKILAPIPRMFRQRRFEQFYQALDRLEFNFFDAPRREPEAYNLPAWKKYWV